MIPTKNYSKKADFFQMFSDDYVCDCVKHKADVSRVRGAGEVRVDLLLVRLAVQRLKSLPDVVFGIIKCVGT